MNPSDTWWHQTQARWSNCHANKPQGCPVKLKHALLSSFTTCVREEASVRMLHQSPFVVAAQECLESGLKCQPYDVGVIAVCANRALPDLTPQCHSMCVCVYMCEVA